MIRIILGITDSVLLLIAFIIIIINWKRLSAALKIFGTYIGLSFFVNTLSIVLIYIIRPYNNFWLLHLLTLGEIILLSFFYYHLVKDNRSFQKFIQITIPIISVLVICNSIFLEPITWYNSNAKTLTQVFIISYSIYYFYVVSTKEILTDSYNKSLYLINSGVLLYYTGSLFIFMFGKLAAHLGFEIWKFFLLFNSILYFIFLIVILISLWRIIYKHRN